MNADQFVKRILKAVVEDGVASYRRNLAHPGDVTDPYWKRLLALYRSLAPAQRRVLLEIMRQVEIDTVSEIFGILDGTSALRGAIEDFELVHGSGKKRVRLNGELQDRFLATVEG